MRPRTPDVPGRGFHALATAWRAFSLAPGQAPRRLERVAAVCLQAPADDSRLGDLSEAYVRTHERARMRLGIGPAAMVASHLAADVHYLAAAVNVVLFARVLDPCLRLAENGLLAFVTLELRERTMTRLRMVVSRLVLPVVLLLACGLLLNSAIDVWYTWRHTETLMLRLQREKAEAAATRIEQFLAGVQSQIGWTTSAWWTTRPVEQRRVDYLRLLRQVPSITEVAQANGDGKEVLRVSRLAMDVVESGVDLARDVRFTQARERRAYFGPVYFRKQSEPYMSLALAQDGASGGVTLAEVNLKPVWEIVRAIEVGKTGYAYIVDGNGRLIAYRDSDLVLRKTDLTSLPQVAGALASASPGPPTEGRAVDSSLSGPPVLSVHAMVPTLAWRVFVDVPVAEARPSVWMLIRGLGLLGLGLAAGLLASLLAARRITLARPAPA